MDNILLPNQIDISKITYGNVKVLGSGGKSIYVSYTGAPMIVQTPEMRSPFGLSKWDKTEKGSDGVEKDSFKYDLLLGFDGKESRENLNTFFNTMKELDTKFVTDGMENSMNWLGKKINSNLVIDELYTPQIRHSRDKSTGEINDKYAPTFKVTIPYREGKFQCSAYGPDKNEMDLSTANLQGAKVTAIIQCVGIWVVGKKYGCSWKVLQMKVNPKSNIPKFAFREIDNDKAADEEHENEEEEVIVQTSDDEEEDDLEKKSSNK